MPQRQLVKSNALPSSFANPHPSPLGEAQGTDGHLRHAQHPHVIGDSPDDSSGFVLFAFHMTCQS